MANTNILARMYDRLSPWERYPLLMAAQARDDDAECRRLLDSAPMKGWRISDHAGIGRALSVLVLIHRMTQLDHLANYWHARYRLAEGNDPKPEDWELGAAARAYCFRIEAEGWRGFLDDLRLSPEILPSADMPGELILGFCGERMPEIAPTFDEMALLFQARGHEADRPRTAQDIVADYREAFNLLAGPWGNARKDWQ